MEIPQIYYYVVSSPLNYYEYNPYQFQSYCCY
jgi:hypothetical protein